MGGAGRDPGDHRVMSGAERTQALRSEEKIRIMGSRSESKITIDNPLEKTKG